MPNVFICAPLDQTNTHYKAQLSHELQAKGIKVVSTLAHAQWAIFIQTPEAVKSPQVQMVLATAMRLKQQQHLRGVLRFVYNPIQQSYSAWDSLPGFDATQNINDVLKQLLQKMNTTPNRESVTNAFEFTREDLQASRPSINNLLIPPSSTSGSLFQQSSRSTAPSPLTSVPRHKSSPLSAPNRQFNGKPPYWIKGFSRPSPHKDAPLYITPIWWFIIAVSMIILLLIVPLLSTSPFSRFASSQNVAVPQRVGKAYFLSSGTVDPNNTSRINDIIQLDLNHLTMPAAHKRYYAWLLPDLSDKESLDISLGAVTVSNGTSNLRYINPAHRNLLAEVSRLLITEDDDSIVPVIPSSDQKDWRYYAEIPQQLDTTHMAGSMLEGSYLDHLRHLLVAQPDLEKLSLHGGLALWLLQNSRKVLEWATAASGTDDLQSPALMHQNLIRILDYIDGLPYVQQDVAAGTPSEVNATEGQIGLLTLNPSAMLPGYVSHVAVHLDAMVHSPGATPSERILAQQIEAFLTIIKSDLEQVREDAHKLLDSSNDFSQSSTNMSLISDLVAHINDAYGGHFDAKTGTQIGGVLWVYDQLQHLATFEVHTYS